MAVAEILLIYSYFLQTKTKAVLWQVLKNRIRKRL